MRRTMRLAAALGAMLAAPFLLRAAAAGAAEAPGGWRADPKLLEELERKKTPWVYREADVPAYELPDPLLCADGSRVATAEQWEKKRRPETLELFRTHVYGRAPARPAKVTFAVTAEDARAMGGKVTLRRVTITSADGAGRSYAFPMALLVPNDRPAGGRVPAFVLINNRPVSSADPTRQAKADFWPAEQIVARGYAAAVFQTNDVDPDRADAASRARGVRGVWPDGSGKAGEDGWATIAAWAWGASRVMDYLQTDAAIDASKVALVGHSRGGKTALWAGAQDERFALVVSNDSGCGGAALSRRRFGETVERINRAIPYWFCGNFTKYNGKEDELPIDQHQLLALIAPRAAYVASADADFWADQRGEYLSLVHASPVHALYGNAPLRAEEMPPLESPLVRGKLAYHIRRGGHGLTLYDWARFMDFADAQWGRASSADGRP